MKGKCQKQIILAVLLCIGLLDALYLSYAQYAQSPLICGVLEGCNAVSASPYSKIFGIPIAYLGVIFYIGMLKMLFWQHFIPTLSTWGRRLFVLGAYIGAAASVVFVYIQYTYIGAFCIYCLLSAIITWTVAVIVFSIKSSTQGNSTPVETP